MACLVLCTLIFEPLDINELDRLANIGIDLTFNYPQRQKKEDADPCTLFFNEFEKNFSSWLQLNQLQAEEQIVLH